MRGISYLQFGSVCMGFGGSILIQVFLQQYLGLRSESVDESEILRRLEQGIYDPEEFERALAWTKENCTQGWDKNPEELRPNKEGYEAWWEFVVKNMLIVRDLMVGNPKLDRFQAKL